MLFFLLSLSFMPMGPGVGADGSNLSYVKHSRKGYEIHFTCNRIKFTLYSLYL